MSSGGDGKVEVGAFARIAVAPYSDYGIGKISRLQGNVIAVTYFDVPDDPKPLEVVIPVAAVRVVSLPEQCRVFQMEASTGHWRVGRVLDGEGPTVQVKFPKGELQNVPREELQIRWRKPIADPVVFLSRRVTETPRFAQARSGFVKAVTEQRAACLGMGAVLSSCIQLTEYQFNVVQRVLQDPVQRYLLADEVGLGKTIEACVLIRQYVIDSAATARVLVVVPPPLVLQWKCELIERFSLKDWLDDFVYVVGSDDLEAVQTHLGKAGMLVVDEAHHLSRLGSDGTNLLYELIRQHAHRVPRLLLLSATPVLSDTAGFLRVLHLLDPVVFPLDDLPGFERRLKSRQLVAESAVALLPENVLSMEDDLDRLQMAFGDDITLNQLVEKLRPIVQALPEENDETFTRALSELRFHLTETYKLHRRILRNRRKSVPWATPQRIGMDAATYSCPIAGERHRALEALRVHLVNLDSITPAQVELFTAAVHPTGAPKLYESIRSMGIQESQALALAQRVDALADEARSRGARVSAVVEVVRRLLQQLGQQVVVFCDQPRDADHVARELAIALPNVVERHRCATLDERDDEIEEHWRVFLNDPSHCRVLVCDVNAEEGINLHGGRKIAVHYDLPASPNRIEQRLGRLDRFGSGDPIRSVALVCSDEPDETAWLECLHKGVQVFSSSIASLQYLVEENMRSAVAEWTGEGTQALVKLCGKLAGPEGWVARERRRINQQDALDALSEPPSESFATLESVDDEWASWRDAFEAFAIDELQFQKRLERWEGPLPRNEQVFRLKYARDDARRTLLSLPSFVSDFLGTIDKEAGHSTWRNPLTFPYAFRRHTALSKQGRALGVRPLRYGDTLIESLFAFCESDDRGRVFAMWRHLPNYEARDASGTDLYFRFDFLIEANVSAIASSLHDTDAKRALCRRAEGIFSPHFCTIWVCAGSSPTIRVPEPLEEEYRPDEKQPGCGRDYNLDPHRWQVLQAQTELPWTRDWREHCSQAHELARAYLTDLGSVRACVVQATRALQTQHDARAAQLTSRIARLQGAARTAEIAELEAEAAAYRRLLSAVRSPSFHLDVSGAVLVSADTPFVR